MTRPRNFAIAQAFNLGDIIACLPMAGAIKTIFPDAKVCFIARPYVKPLLDACANVDGFIDAEAVLQDHEILRHAGLDVFLNPSPHRELAEAAYRADIPLRVGNLRRGSYVRWCNRFVFYGRATSGLHEAQLNLKELRGIGLAAKYSLAELPGLIGLTRLPSPPADLTVLLDAQRFNLILHPKSKGNSREWPLASYLALARSLPRHFIQIFITGDSAEGRLIAQQCPELLEHPNVVDLTDRMDLASLIGFIAAADGLIAASTGPLHIAAAVGIFALGLYPGRPNFHPRRWGPVGIKAESLCTPFTCRPGPSTCPRRSGGEPCKCMEAIAPQQVIERILRWLELGGTMRSPRPQPPGSRG